MQMEVNPDEEDVVTVEIKSDIQLILSVLCEGEMHRKVKSAHDYSSTVEPTKFYIFYVIISSF